ncbi:MAG: PKD domain-containing protein [Thermoanaerobaculales bacterium]
MRRMRSFAVAVTLVVTLGAVQAWGQSCYIAGGGSPLSSWMGSICATGASDQSYFQGSTVGVYPVNVAGTSYIAATHYNSMDLWDATNPISPARLTQHSVALPYSITTTDLHFGEEQHFADVATVDEFPYAIVSLGSVGWDFFKLSTGAFLGRGYDPTTVIKGFGYASSALFWDSGQPGTGNVYAAGQMLDDTAIAAADSSVYIYLLQDAAGRTTPDTLTSTTMTQHRYRVPAGTSADGAFSSFRLGTGGSLVFYMYTSNGAQRLLAGSSSGALVVDVSNPTSPTPLAVWTKTTATSLFSGPWAVDAAHGKLNVADSSTEKVYTFDLANPATPTLVATRTWHTPLSFSPVRPPSEITAGDNVVAVACGTYIGYLATDNTGVPLPTAMPDLEPPLTDPTQATYVNPHQCVHPNDFPSIYGLAVFTAASRTNVARAVYSWGDIIGINTSCLLSTPTPNFSVTATPANLSAGAATCTPTGLSNPLAAKGFPGDMFTIADNSGGAIASGTLTLTQVSTGSLITSWSRGSSAGSWTPALSWPAPASQTPGEYQLDLLLRDAAGAPYESKQSIWLCGNPNAGARIDAVSGISCQTCSYISSDTLEFNADPSQGTPLGYQWLITPPQAGTQAPYPTGNTTTLDLSKNLTGSYGPNGVVIVAEYAFSAPTDTTNCTNLGVPSGALNADHYNSCSAMTPAIDAEPFFIGSGGIQITQPTGPTNPPFLIAKAINLSLAFKVANGWTANFAWGLTSNGSDTPATPAATPATQTGTFAGAVTGTIPANTLLAGNTYTVKLSQATAVNNSDSTQSVSPSIQPKSFAMTSCNPPGQATGLSASPSSVTSGSAVTLSWTVPSGTGQFTYDVKTPPPIQVAYTGCLGLSTPQCSYTTSAAGTHYWVVVTHSPCGGADSTSASASFTVSNPNPTPTPTPNPTPTPTPPPSCAYSSAPYGLGISSNPTTIVAGTPVTFTGSYSGGTSSDTTFKWTLDPTSITPKSLGTANPLTSTFTTSQAGLHTLSFQATNCFGSASTQVSINVTSSCGATSAPTAGFTYTPANPKIGDVIQFTDASSGSPTSWAWNFGDGAPPLVPSRTSTAKNPTLSYSKAAAYTVTLTATNCKGTSALVSAVVTVAPQCAFTAAPGIVLGYSPIGPMPGFPEQQQPMVGQVVTFDPSASTNIDGNTKWNWAFAGGTPATSAQETPQVTFNAPVMTTVVMNATNCFGMSWFTGSGQVYADVRHVTADFSWDATSPTTGSVITFTANSTDALGDPDTFTWNFGDSTPAQTGRTTIHTFSCSGNYNVTLVASGHGQTSQPLVKPIGVAGKMCGPTSLMAVDAADLSGLNGTHWQTDVRIFNPAPDKSTITMWFLPVGQDNTTPAYMGLTLQPKATWSIDNVLDFANKQLTKSYTKSALRITYDNPESMAPMIVSRTYTQAAGGGTYGQYTPSVGVIPDTTPPTLWVTGLRNNGTSSSTPGFRTNYSLVNLRGDAGGISNIKITLLDPAGAEKASTLLGIPPFGYFQGSIANLFNGQFANIGVFALRVDVPDGTDLQFDASVVDNQTGAPTLIPGGVPGTTPIYLPAIGHTPGLNGSVWRSDLQMTNPDTAPHNWEVKFSPSQSGLPTVAQVVTLAPKNTWRQDDIVSWAYGPLQTPDTNGVVRIACVDGSNLYPVVASSSYNVTAGGTFGQNNIPLTAAMGVATATPMQHLLLTALSSADIARTNLGLINLSENNGVSFSVIFYDESGHVLNPIDPATSQPKPFTQALNVGGLLQAQLESFLSVLGTTLPPGTKAVSAEVTVLAGGPGFAYATVIDNLTNDPMYVPAQLAP